MCYQISYIDYRYLTSSLFQRICTQLLVLEENRGYINFCRDFLFKIEQDKVNPKNARKGMLLNYFPKYNIFYSM